MKKIYCFHLLNDYSGSPKVLSQLINGWVASGYEVHLCTSLRKEGFLSELKGVNYHDNQYKYYQNKALRLFSLLYSQIICIISIFRLISRDDLIYINTVLPFGAAILGKLKSIKVIYHIHETSIRPLVLKKFLFGIAKWSAAKCVYVSHFLANQETGFKSKVIIHNAIGDAFLSRAEKYKQSGRTPNNVLMVCSLKKYKGVDEFVSLARECGEYNFRLVLNASQSEIDNYFHNIQLPENLEIYPTQRDVHPFYQWSDIVLNLSLVTEWLETFGLTAIEAGAYGRPTIVPPEGGIAELITDGIQGYKIDSRNQAQLIKKIDKLLKNRDLYKNMSKQALENVRHFSESKFISKSIALIEG